MNTFAANRTADRCFTALRFFAVDNIIASNLVHGDMDRVIGIDLDGFRHARGVAARSVIDGNRYLKRRMRLKLGRRNIHLPGQFPRQSRNLKHFASVRLMIDDDGHDIANVGITDDQAANRRGRFLRFSAVENVIARYRIDREMDMRLLRLCDARPRCRRGDHWRRREPVRRIADHGCIVQPR